MVRGSQGRERVQGRKASSSGEATSRKRAGPRAAHSGRGRPASSELDARQLQAIALYTTNPNPNLYITNPNKTVVAAEIRWLRDGSEKTHPSALCCPFGQIGGDRNGALASILLR